MSTVEAFGSAGIRWGTPQARWVLGAAVGASGLALLDATAVNVALPAIGADLDARVAGLQWTVNAYTLSLASLILLAGSMADRYGRRRMFLIGITWFALASLLCAAAPTLDIGDAMVAKAESGDVHAFKAITHFLSQLRAGLREAR